MLEDLAVEDDFAEDFTLRGVTFSGIFDNDSAELRSDLGEPGAGGVESRQPQITCRSADVVGVQSGDVIKRLATADTYRVKYEAPDGQGVSVIFLRR